MAGIICQALEDGTLKPYVLNVTLNGSHITGSPFDLTLQPARAAAGTCADIASHVIDSI